jgi:ABC-type phosphate/phosphonate transport system ATPase subunit
MCRTVVKELPESVSRMQVMTNIVVGFLNRVDTIYNQDGATRDGDPAAALELLELIDGVRPILNINRRFLTEMATQR